MKLNEIQNPASCKCGSKQFAISRVRLNYTGPYLEAIVCTNPNCKITYGQVEPSSITTNLAQINEVMAQVEKSLETFNNFLSNQSSSVHSNAAQTTAAAKSIGAGAGNHTPTPTTQNGINPNGTAEVNPAEDPESSDPEADQSLE